MLNWSNKEREMLTKVIRASSQLQKVEEVEPLVIKNANEAEAVEAVLTSTPKEDELSKTK